MSAADAEGRSTRILVAEDGAVQARQLQTVLEADGYSVTVAADGERAFALLQSESFDVVLSGADNFVVKPCDPDYLRERVRNILENRNLRRAGKLRLGAEVMFLGKKVTITSDKDQILDLLISTFENMVRTNRELRQRETELGEAKNQLHDYARQLEDRVRSSAGKYHSLMEHAHDAIFILDGTGCVQEANRRAEELLGEPAAAMLGSPCARCRLHR